MRYTDLMIDIETLGTRPGSVITQIGAVAFNRASDDPKQAWKRNLDIRAQMRRGFEVDPDTLAWWMRQADEARLSWASEEAQKGAALPTTALKELSELIGIYTTGNCLIWANSPSFDLVLLEALFRSADVRLPWAYYQAADVRTLKHLCPEIAMPKPANAHDAVDDAIAQAIFVQACWKSITGEGSALAGLPS